MESLVAVSNVFRPETPFRQNNQFQHQPRLILPGSYDTNIISDLYQESQCQCLWFLNSNSVNFNFRNRWLWCICGLLLFTPLQEFLLLGIFIVSFEMSSALPISSCLIGFKCTNNDCSRIFPHRSQLLRHKHNKAHRGTDCANMELAKKVYQINDNRADNLQPARIVYRPLSGDVLHPAASLRNDLSAVSWVSAVVLSINMRTGTKKLS